LDVVELSTRRFPFGKSTGRGRDSGSADDGAGTMAGEFVPDFCGAAEDFNAFLSDGSAKQTKVAQPRKTNPKRCAHAFMKTTYKQLALLETPFKGQFQPAF
jgi:hypothetical protein